MKTFVVLALACLTSSPAAAASTTAAISTPPPSTTTSLHFNFVCTNENGATITVNSGYIAGNVGNCIPGSLGNNKYNLDSNCVPGGMFIIEKLLQNTTRVKNDIFFYKLNCTDKSFLQIVSASIDQVKVSSVSPTQESGSVSHSPLLMQMTLNSKNSITHFSDFQNNSIDDVLLGQTVYLFISPTVKENSDIIPQHCNASSGSKTLTLWQLPNANNGNKCFREEAVMKTSFTIQQIDNVGYAVARFEAFQFEESPDGKITFTCEIRVCGSISKTSQCASEKAALQCPQTKQGNGRRRRRDVIEELADGPPGQGRLHHVSATLRIRDETMATGMSSRVYYTVISLILPILALVV